MIDEAFFYPRTPIAVIALGDSGEARLIRTILESLGAAVNLHLPGTPADFLLCLAQGQAAPDFIILSCHGDANGFIMNEVADGIDGTFLRNGSLPPEVLTNHIALPGKTIISTGCMTGRKTIG